MALTVIASATTISMNGATTAEITGVATIQTINGVPDGQKIVLYPAGAFVLGGAGNISALTGTATVGRPITLVARNGTLYEIQGAGANFSAGVVSANLGSIVFSNSGGVSFGLTGSTITATVATNYQSSGAYLTTAMFSNRGTDFVQASAAFSGVNATGTINSTGITVSVAAPGGGVNLSGFEPFPLANPCTTTFLPPIGSWFFQPFVAPQGIASGRINILCSYSNSNGGVFRMSNGASFASNTTGTRSVSISNVDSFALYSRGAGANSTRIESFWSNTWHVALVQTVSVKLSGVSNVSALVSNQLVYPASVGSDGAYTMSTINHSGALSSGASAWGTSLLSSLISSELNILSGQVLQAYGFNTSIAAGMYWFAQGWSQSSTTGGTSIPDVWPFVNQVGIYGLSSMPYRPFGVTVSNTSSQIWPGAGGYSAVSGVPPPTVPFADIRSIASHVTQYFNFLNIPL